MTKTKREQNLSEDQEKKMDIYVYLCVYVSMCVYVTSASLNVCLSNVEEGVNGVSLNLGDLVCDCELVGNQVEVEAEEKVSVRRGIVLLSQDEVEEDRDEVDEGETIGAVDHAPRLHTHIHTHRQMKEREWKDREEN